VKWQKGKQALGPNLLKYFRPEAGERQELARTTEGMGNLGVDGD
jgi:hypothetical protein